MGALTLKRFPFVLRDWDTQSHDSIDPTDSFGQDIKIYVNKNQIIKIEPQFSNTNQEVWITDKGRQFFDSMFSTRSKKNNQRQNTFLTKTQKQWEMLFKTITQTFYVFDICNLKNSNKHYFVVLFENVTLETLNILFLMSQTYSFLKLRRANNFKINNDLEFNSQVSSGTSVSRLKSSSLCVTIGTDVRFEGSYLNLKLRQRYFKGNFKVLSIGSLKEATFPVFSLGSNLSIFKTIVEGNNVTCADLVSSKNPIQIINTETLKRKDVQHILDVMRTTKYNSILSNVWNGFNTLNSFLNEAGINRLNSFCFLTFKDLLFFSSFYIIGSSASSIKNLKKITESKLLKLNNFNKFFNTKVLVNQDHNFSNTSFSKLLLFKKQIYLPSNIFFENNETVVNTEGLVKKTTKLVFRNKTKSNWQLLRKLAKNSENIFFVNSLKDNALLFFNNKNLSNFRNFTNFQFFATQTLTNLGHHFNSKNKPFVVFKQLHHFRKTSTKIFKTKLKYWLDDFFTGGKDGYCQESLTMINCSNNLRLQTTNFF